MEVDPCWRPRHDSLESFGTSSDELEALRSENAALRGTLRRLAAESQRQEGREARLRAHTEGVGDVKYHHTLH